MGVQADEKHDECWQFSKPPQLPFWSFIITYVNKFVVVVAVVVLVVIVLTQVS